MVVSKMICRRFDFLCKLQALGKIRVNYHREGPVIGRGVHSTNVADPRTTGVMTRQDKEYSRGKESLAFNPRKAIVLSKFSRYEFERRRNPELTERELAQKLADRGSDYNSLVYHHSVHSRCVDNVAGTLKSYGIDTKIVKRLDYSRPLIDWADVIITVGGDGTFLLAASRLTDNVKPVIGINSDPSRSEGYLCLPRSYYSKFSEAMDKLLSGRFRWKYRQRIRITLIGSHAFDSPVELHDQQLIYPEYRFLDCMQEDHGPGRPSGPSNKLSHTLPVLALNEVFVGESLSSRVSYYEISIDGSPRAKQKSSGVTVCTGTGSSSWNFNINKLTKQCVHSLLNIVKEETRLKFGVDDQMVKNITNKFNSRLLFDASVPRMAYTIRDPVVNGTVHASSPRGFAERIEIKSRCFDACLVIDGGLSYSFNDGAKAILEINPDDALKTVELDDDIEQV